MSAVRATEVARGRWQLDGRATAYACGCRALDAPDGTSRRVATCKAHRRGVGAPLIPWAPA